MTEQERPRTLAPRMERRLEIAQRMRLDNEWAQSYWADIRDMERRLEAARTEGRQQAVREIRQRGHEESGTYDTAGESSERAIEIGDFDRILDRVAGLNASESGPPIEQSAGESGLASSTPRLADLLRDLTDAVGVILVNEPAPDEAWRGLDTAYDAAVAGLNASEPPPTDDDGSLGWDMGGSEPGPAYRLGDASESDRIVVLPPASWAEGAADLLEQALYLRSMSIDDALPVEKAITDHLNGVAGCQRVGPGFVVASVGRSRRARARDVT